jgi:hypothetical protein
MGIRFLIACSMLLFGGGTLPAQSLVMANASMAQWANELGGTAVRCENGYCATSGVPSPYIRLFDGNGNLVRENDAGIPGAAAVTVKDISVLRSGFMAAAVRAVNADGAMASAVALYNGTGAPSLVVRTDPFFATRVALSSDGYLWVLGSFANRRFDQDYGMFRKYSLDGRLVGEFLNRLSLNPKRGPFDEDAIGGSSVMVAWSGGVGAYIPLSQEWLEVDNSGNLVGRWKLAEPTLAKTPTPGSPRHAARMVRLAATESGSIYSFWIWDERRALCKLDRKSGVWQEVDGSQSDYFLGPRSQAAFLLGSDGGALLFKAPTRDGQGRAYVARFSEPQPAGR